MPALEESAKTREKETAGGGIWKESGAILLVDDEETVREVGRRMLERAGFSVLMASDGTEALELYRKHGEEIVCVILDLSMPRMNGEETFREMRAFRPNVRVILTSGYNEQEATDRFAGKALAGFIQKPFHYAQLVETVRRTLHDSPNS